MANKVRKRRFLQAERLEDRWLLAADLESEPNDSMALADRLTLQTSEQVPGLFRGNFVGQLQAGRSDFIRFEARAGDRVSVSTFAAEPGIDPAVFVLGRSGNRMASNSNAGLGQGSLTETVTLPYSGVYFIEVAGTVSSTDGGYEFDAILARSLPFESDQHRRNDRREFAEPWVLEFAGKNTYSGTIGGTISASDGSGADIDYYRLGNLKAGQSVSLSVAVPQWSALAPFVDLVDASGNSLVDADPSDASFTGEVAEDAEYFAVLSSVTGAGASSQYAVTAAITDMIAPEVTALDRFPHDASVSEQLFSMFTITFSEDLDPTSIVPAALDLRGPGLDEQFDTGDDILYTLEATYDAQVHQIDFIIVDGPLGNGDYRLTLASTITDIFGNPLGNGTPYRRTFSVDALLEGMVFEGRENGSYEQATPLRFEPDENGTGWLRSEGGRGLSEPGYDYDWWSFDAFAGDHVDVWGVPQQRSAKINFHLVRPRDDGPQLDWIESASVLRRLDNTPYISNVLLPSDGTYYILVVPGYRDEHSQYDLRVTINRNHEIETDANDNNQTISGADPLVFDEAAGERSAEIAGTIMGAADVDYFQLGYLNSGTTISIDASSLPSWSILEASVEVVSEDGTVVSDDDASEAIFQGTLDSDATYYARVWTSTAVIDGSRFFLTDQKSGWNDAHAAAVAAGGDLASIGNEAQNRLLSQTFGGNHWIGLHDADADETFQWSDGSAVDFTAVPQEAAKFYDNVFLSKQGDWFATFESRNLHGIIEVPAEPGAPTLSGGGLLAQYLLSIKIGDLVPPTVSNVDRLPDEGRRLDQLISTFSVSFSEPLDTKTLTAEPFELRGAGDDGILNTADDILYRLGHEYEADTFELRFKILDGPMLPGEHRLSILDNVTDVAGNQLDGDSNRLAEGDFVRTFRVAPTPDGSVIEGRDSDTFAKATPLALQADSNRTGWFRSEVGRGVIALGGDGDSWSFDALAGDYVDVWAEADGNDARFSLDLYRTNEDGTEFNWFATDDAVYRSQGPAHISSIVLPADGTFYVLVTSSFSPKDDAQYQLNINVNRDHQIAMKSRDNNHSIGSATTLPFQVVDTTRSAAIAGTVMPGNDLDYYRLGYLNAGTSVTLDASVLPDWSTLNPLVEVITEDGTLVADQDIDAAVFRATLTSDSTYYARIRATVVIDSSRFFLTDQSSAWNDAEAAAIAAGGHLASIDNDAQNRMLLEALGPQRWIGLGLAEDAETLVWSDGSTVDYVNTLSQPKGSSDRFILSSDGGWFGLSDHSRVVGLVEVPLEPGAPMRSGRGVLSQYLFSVEIVDRVAPTIAKVPALPAAGQRLERLISRFTVSFSEALDPDTLAVDAFELRGPGDDLVLDTADDLLYDLRHEYDNDTFQVNLTVLDGPISEGEHRLTIHDRLTDVLGNALDGDGDHVAGGDYSRSFDVDAIPEGAVSEGRSNGVYENATRLTLQADTSGTGWLRSEVGLGAIATSDDHDWWQFNALAGDIVNVWADLVENGSSLPVTLYQWNDAQERVVAITKNHAYGSPETATNLSSILLPSDGTYYVQVQPGSFHDDIQYQLHINVNRQHDLEWDQADENGSIETPGVLTFEGADTLKSATIAGTIMGGGDVDYYRLGFLNAGTTITLDASVLPDWSILNPTVEVVSEDGTLVADEDADDAIFHASLTADNTYYARVLTRSAVIDGSRFMLTDQASSWTAAEAAAVAVEGHLASIENAAQNRLLQETFGGNRWIGFNYAQEERTFQWSDGSAVGYTNWGTGYARFTPHVALHSSGNWYAYYRGTDFYGIIELPAEPGSPTLSGAGPLSQYLLSIDIQDQVPPTVRNVSPLPAEGGTLERLVSRFAASFSEAIDPDTWTAATFELRAAGDDLVLDTADDIVYGLSHEYDADSFELRFTILGGPLLAGEHRLTIRDSIFDVFGNAFDGDDNDIAGGDFIRTFTVDAISEDSVFEGHDNGEHAKATALEFESDANGTGWLRSQPGRGAIDPSRDEDWWSFDAMAGDHADVWVVPRLETSTIFPTLYRRDEEGGDLVELSRDDDFSGPKNASYLSGIPLPVDGTYYVQLQTNDAQIGGQYDIRVLLGRGTAVETDGDHANDVNWWDDAISFSDDGDLQRASVLGTVMSGELRMRDKDEFPLGMVLAGQTVLVRVQTPSWSTLQPQVEIRGRFLGIPDVLSVHPIANRTDVAIYVPPYWRDLYAVVSGLSGQSIEAQYRLDVTLASQQSVADLGVTTIAAPDSFTAGDDLTISWETGNFGTTTTNVDLWVDRVVLSANQTLGDFDDIVLGDVIHYGALDAGDSYAAQLTTTTPLQLLDNYHLFVQTDVKNNRFELLPENNTLQSPTPLVVAAAPLPQLIGLPTGSVATDHDAFQIQLAKSVQLATVRDAVSIARDGTPLSLDSLSIRDLGDGRYEVTGLSSIVTIDGNYSVTLDAPQLPDLDGEAGGESTTRSWTRDTTPPVTRVIATPLGSTTRRYRVAVENDELDGAAVTQLQLYAASENSPLRLVRQLDPNNPVAEFESELDEPVHFFNDAVDAAGNRQPLIIGGEGSDKIPIDASQLEGLPDAIVVQGNVELDFRGQWNVGSPVVQDAVLVHQVEHGGRLFHVTTTTPWKNPVLPWDVNRDGSVTPLDALQILNQLNRTSGSFDLPELSSSDTHRYYDVSGDGYATPQDMLRILNYLNRTRVVDSIFADPRALEDREEKAFQSDDWLADLQYALDAQPPST